MLSERIFTTAKFTKSLTDIKNAPTLVLPEFAFAGRSNVGKSSLLNAIFNRKSLVKTSSSPGKTQLINYFNIGEKFYCVDLPGYGYAKIPKKILATWKGMIENYFTNNRNLQKVYLLIDSRHKLMANDKQMIEWLNLLELNYTLILSKFDKLNRQQALDAIKHFKSVIKSKSVLPFSIHNQEYIIKLKDAILMDLT